MTVTVWSQPVATGAAGITVPVSAPVVYARADSTELEGGVLTVLSNGQPVSRWGASAWQRAEIH